MLPAVWVAEGLWDGNITQCMGNIRGNYVFDMHGKNVASTANFE